MNIPLRELAMLAAAWLRPGLSAPMSAPVPNGGPVIDTAPSYLPDAMPGAATAALAPILEPAFEPTRPYALAATSTSATVAVPSPRLPSIDPAWLAAMNANVPWEHWPPAVRGDPSSAAAHARAPRWATDYFLSQSRNWTCFVNRASRASPHPVQPGWATSKHPLRIVESLLVRPLRTFAELSLLQSCAPLSPQALELADHLTAGFDALAGLLFKPFGIAQGAGTIAGRIADLVDNTPLNPEQAVNELLSFGLMRGELPRMSRSGNTVMAGGVKYVDLGGTRYAVRNEYAERMETYDPSRPADPGAWLTKTGAGAWRFDIPEHYAVTHDAAPAAPGADGISVVGDALLIAHGGRYFRVSHDPAFGAYWVEPPPQWRGAYRIPVEYQPATRTWSARAITDTHDVYSTVLVHPGGLAAGGFTVEHIAVTGSSAHQAMADLDDVVSAVRRGTPRHRAIDPAAPEIHDASHNELSAAEGDALREFLSEDPLLGAARRGVRPAPPADAAPKPPDEAAARLYTRRYGALRDALRKLPAQPSWHRRWFVAGAPELGDAFAAGEFVTTGAMPLTATTEARAVARMLAHDSAAGARAPHATRVMFAIRGWSARVVSGMPGQIPAHGRNGGVFLPDTRFLIESITRATPLPNSGGMPQVRWKSRYWPAGRAPIVLVRLREMLPYDGPAPSVDAKALRTGVVEPVLRPDLADERLTALQLGARLETDARGIHTLADGGTLAYVDDAWQPVHYVTERQRWELLDRRRPQQSGMPIVLDGADRTWRSAVAPECAAEPGLALVARADSGIQTDSQGQTYIELYGHYYRAHRDPKTWRITPADTASQTAASGVRFRADARGVPVRFEQATGQWGIRPRAYQRQVLRLRGGAPGRFPPGIVSGLTRVTSRTGLVAEHLPKLQALAERENLIIAFRPVERYATQLIAEGYPTKDFHIKGKSSDWGPMAGFIPVDQTFSKLNGRPRAIEKFNAKVLESLNLPPDRPGGAARAASGPLTVSEARLQYLAEQGLITLRPGPGERGTLEARGRDGRDYTFTAIPERGGYRIEHDGMPLYVLCDLATRKGITADYDLLLVAPHIGEYGELDGVPLKDTSHDVFKARMENYASFKAGGVDALPAPLRDAYLDPAKFYAKAHKDMGNTSARTIALIPKLNRALGRANELHESALPAASRPGPPLVHHGADAANPFTEPGANYPATFFFPSQIGELEKVVLVENSQALAYVIQQAKDQGYQVPLNPQWEDDVRGVSRSSFTRSRSDLESRSRGQQPLQDTGWR